MKKTLLILTVIGLQAGYSQGYWDPWQAHAKLHASLEMHNPFNEQMKLKYCKTRPGFAAVLTRARILQPGKNTTITLLLKDRLLRYQQAESCPEDCEQTGDHTHWGKIIKVPFQVQGDDHIQLTIRNEGLDMVKIGYYNKMVRIEYGNAVTPYNECSRRLHLKPGKKATIHVLKNRSFRYQNNVGCPEDCEQIGDHYHWGEKIEVPFKKGQSIVLGATKSASKKG